jgi:UDP-4-amino-4,6-dideoxy-N-acetyl-beta-L-altrosamine N-acetyltransferase
MYKVNNIQFVNILETDLKIKEKVRKWRNKETVKNYMISQNAVSGREHLNWLNNLKESKSNKVWVIFIYDSPVGAAYLKNIDFKNLCSEWGFYIGEDSFRKKGYGKKILYELLKKYFEEMEFNELKTLVLRDNAVALKIYKKFGFREKNIYKVEDKNVLELEFHKKDWNKERNRLWHECK